MVAILENQEDDDVEREDSSNRIVVKFGRFKRDDGSDEEIVTMDFGIMLIKNDNAKAEVACMIIAIAISYVVEVLRLHVIRVHQIIGPKEIVPMNIFCLLPQYVLLGIADVFNAIGLLEFFYNQSPEDMQSLGTTFFSSGIGIENFLNNFLVIVVDKITSRGNNKSWIGDNLNDSHLDYYRFLLVISTLNLGAFLWASSIYVYKRETNEVNEGSIEMDSKALEKYPIGFQL
ncbi:protein NRT1/ PTR FAMILY 5.1-like [Hibiscus syriacus]|uniref:protein NRT1/ PTR FAMILY 5.1-like n=1 Tax=Hibiscus syriacus TaxID=106335 RepID=UPI00192106F6|nr:protein NRT1/ PTR FAMILY 5.1-like [Hibiscus syriacus]